MRSAEFPDEAKKFHDPLDELSVLLLAEMEHDRWNADRLRNGWAYAPGEKNIDKKTSPYIVPWEDLSEEIRELDVFP